MRLTGTVMKILAMASGFMGLLVSPLVLSATRADSPVNPAELLHAAHLPSTYWYTDVVRDLDADDKDRWFVRTFNQPNLSKGSNCISTGDTRSIHWVRGSADAKVVEQGHQTLIYLNPGKGTLNCPYIAPDKYAVTDYGADVDDIQKMSTALVSSVGCVKSQKDKGHPGLLGGIKVCKPWSELDWALEDTSKAQNELMQVYLQLPTLQLQAVILQPDGKSISFQYALPDVPKRSLICRITPQSDGSNWLYVSF